jgi:hypothetical protein
MQVIQHQELASSQASITFSSIPQTFTDLYVVLSIRNTSSQNYYTLQFNGSSSNFSMRILYGTGSTSASTTSPADYAGELTYSSQTANTFANNSIYIPNYTSANNKSYSMDSVQETNGSAANQVIGAGLWSNTAAITSITFNVSGSFAQYSSATLYGITKGSDGVTTVS